MVKRGVLLFTLVSLLLFLSSCAQDYGYEDRVDSITQELQEEHVQGKTNQDDQKQQNIHTTLPEASDLTGAAHEPRGVYITESYIFDPDHITMPPGEIFWQLDSSIEEEIRLQYADIVSEHATGGDIILTYFDTPGTYTVEVVNKGRSMQVVVE